MSTLPAQVEALQTRQEAVILGIETSCDETAAAVVANGRHIRSSIIASQIQTHALYGGVVPEIASREHVSQVDPLIDEALAQAGLSLRQVDALAVTAGPGLVGALLTGICSAKAIAYALDKPLVPVNHIEGHICANYLAHPGLRPPFLCLVVSGGHSHLVWVADYGRYRLLGQTLDDAAGEAFDKAARLLGLPYPGGPLLDRLAEQGDPHALALPVARTQGRYDYSFSGLKTALAQTLRKAHGLSAADIAASFRRAVVEALISKALLAARDEKAPAIAMAGGVASNLLLRRELEQGARALGIPLYAPPPALCTDNAAMIAGAGFYRLMAGETADLRLNAMPNWSLLGSC